MRWLASRVRTLAGLFAHFASGRRFFLVPLLLVLLPAGLLLLATGGLSYVAPFLYSLF